MRVLPVHVAGRVVVGGMLLLPMLGSVAYSRAVFGVRAWWPLASGLVAYNGTLLSGFLNFIAGLGLALLLAAGWIKWRDAWPVRTVVLVSVGTITLFFCHLMGLLFCFILIGGFEIEWIWRRVRTWSGFVRRASALLPLLPGLLILYAESGLASASSQTHWLGARAKLAQLLVAFVNYDLALDVVTAGAVAGFIVGCVAVRRAVVPMRSGLALAALGVLYVASPFEFKGTAALDTRFAIMLGFMLFAGVLPVLPRRVAGAAGVAFAALFGVRMAVLAMAWHGHARDLADFRRVIAGVAPGTRVYLTSVPPAAAPEYWRHADRGRLLSDGTRTDYHMAALLVIEHRAFWPFLFDQTAQQPIAVAPRYHALAVQTLELPDAAFVATCRGAADPLAAGNAFRGYDDVLMLDAGAVGDLGRCGSGNLELLARSDIAALFRVKPPAAASATRPESRVDMPQAISCFARRCER